FRMTLKVLCGAVAFLALSSAQALTLQSCGDGETPIIEVSGPIQESDLSAIKFVCDTKKRKHILLTIDSPGGSVNEAIAIGNWLRGSKGLVMVREGAACYSSCVLLVAGAALRFLDGEIGIHRPYFNQSPAG